MIGSQQHYASLREPFVPERRKVIFIFESPPSNGTYFYNPIKEGGEQLYHAMMQRLLPETPRADKHAGLRAFADGGYLILDATYTPVDKLPEGRKRNGIVAAGFQTLVAELTEYAQPDTRVICVKANVCRLVVENRSLIQRLKDRKFNVLNRGPIVPFPAYHHQSEFGARVRELLAS